MKVCTDACLFGSLAPTPPHGCQKVLDIGTGTGLLAMMYAQKNPHVLIEAVEKDIAAAGEAKENFESSPWPERLKVYNASIQDFVLTHPKQYDFIISNPPFFENDLKSNDDKRNLALHSAELTLEELIFSIDALLKHPGTFSVLLPFRRIQYFEELAYARHFHPFQKTLVKQTPKHNYFRGILSFSRTRAATSTNEITIQNEAGNYTPAFIELLKDYYLRL